MAREGNGGGGGEGGGAQSEALPRGDEWRKARDVTEGKGTALRDAVVCACINTQTHEKK